MANEIKQTIALLVSNGEYSQSVQKTLTQDQSGLGASSGIVIVGTSEETLSFTDITTEGVLFLQNLDATNYVTYGPDSTGMVSFGRLNPGEVHMLRLSPGLTFKWQANTASVKVNYLLLED